MEHSHTHLLMCCQWLFLQHNQSWVVAIETSWPSKAKHIYYLALCRKSLPSSALRKQSGLHKCWINYSTPLETKESDKGNRQDSDNKIVFHYCYLFFLMDDTVKQLWYNKTIVSLKVSPKILKAVLHSLDLRLF